MSAASKTRAKDLPRLSDTWDDASWAPTELSPNGPPTKRPSYVAPVAPLPSLDDLRPRTERTLLMPNAPRLRAVATVPRKRVTTKRSSTEARQILYACAAGLATFLSIVGATIAFLD